MTRTARARRTSFGHVFGMGALIAGLLSFYCLAPLADAWWYRDDFWMLTLSRYVDNPLQFWNSDHSASFFYRPFGMMLWWATNQLFGADPSPHYVVNIILHWGVAIAFGAWMLALARNVWVGVVAMLFYAVHPVAIRTSEWLSDRFDLLATAFVFISCALMLSRWDSRWRRVILCVAATFACTSKESGFLVLPLVIAHWLSEPSDPGMTRARARGDALHVSVVVFIVGCARMLVMSAHGATPVDASLLRLIPDGLLAFTSSLPLALTGQFDTNSAAGRALPFVALFAFVLICVRAIFDKKQNGLSSRTVVLATTLIATAALLHAPIAAQNLYGAALLNDPISARLFHMTLAGGFLLLLAPCMHIVRGARIHSAWWMLVAATISLATATHSFRLAQAWSTMTSGELRPLLVQTVNQVDVTALTDRCRIVVHGPLAYRPDFQRLSDIMVKALAQNSSGQLLHCVVVAVDQAPTFAIVARELCAGNAIQQVATIHPTAKPRPFANLCYQFLVPPFLSNSRTKSLDVNIR